jgi:pimeloyl-ACP methyl ester carboxylesterase
MTIECFDVALAHGITLSCRAAGPPGATPSVILLHGFPEAAFVWDAVMQRVAPKAHCMAPNLRGYERSSAPSEVEAYRAKHLVADLVALIERFGRPLPLLVAHDWGGALAWNLAAQRPDLVRRLLIINAPHPATFLRELRGNPAQQRASAYMNFLCRADASALLAEDDFAQLWRFFTGAGGGAWLDERQREQYRAVWRAGLEGPLNYYRASPLRPGLSAGDAIWKLKLHRKPSPCAYRPPCSGATPTSRCCRRCSMASATMSTIWNWCAWARPRIGSCMSSRPWWPRPSRA